MQWIIANSCRAALLMFLLASAAIAGPLPTDPAAIAGWKGSQLFTTTKITATVEYAVYAPGQFSASAALGSPVDPSGGSDWVYAYEIFATNTPVLTLTVGIQPGNVPASYVGTNRIGDLPFSPELGESPDSGTTNVFYNWSTSLLAINNARWTNATNGSNPDLWKNNHSTVLFFTAPFGPQWRVSTISGGSTAVNSQNLPSPVPEPGTAVMAAIAAAFLLAAQWRRRRSASR
jgi:hypothetical protein